MDILLEAMQLLAAEPALFAVALGVYIVRQAFVRGEKRMRENEEALRRHNDSNTEDFDKVHAEVGKVQSSVIELAKDVSEIKGYLKMPSSLGGKKDD